MTDKSVRYMKWAWLICMAAVAAAWMSTVDFAAAGMDARYYFTAASQVVAGQDPYVSGDFLYPSALAWLLAPAVTLLPAAIVAMMFNVLLAISVLALVAGAIVLTGLHPWSKRAPGAFGAYWWLPAILTVIFLFSGVTVTVLALGNISPIIGALCVWGGVLYRREQYIAAAIVVAFASVLKVIPLLLLVLMFTAGLRRRHRGMIASAIIGTVVFAAGTLLPPFAIEFMNGAGGNTKWGIDIGGACISVHIWLARALDDGFVNHPDIAFIVFATAAAITALYGYFSRPGAVIRWLTVMMLADIASPKNCPHLFMAMTFPLFVMFSHYLADGASILQDTSRRVLRLAMAVAIPVVASTSEFFYFRGHPFGTLVLPLIPILAAVFQALELNGRKSWLPGPVEQTRVNGQNGPS